MKGNKSHGKKSDGQKGQESRSEESEKELLIVDQFGKPMVVEDTQVNTKLKEGTKMETKEVVKQETNLPSTEAMGAWGSEGIDKKDIMLPKILMMQGLSVKVAEGKAAMGDLINSLSGEKLGDRSHPVEVIPISTWKTWTISKKAPKAGKFEYDSTVPATKENYREWDDREVTEADGSITRYDETLNFFVLVAKELEEGAALPYVLSCRRTSYKAGKMIIGHFTKMGMLKQPPAAKTLKLSCKQERNDDGPYDVMVVENGRVSTPEEIHIAYEWYKTLGTSTVKIDDSDLKGAEQEAEEGNPQY